MKSLLLFALLSTACLGASPTPKPKSIKDTFKIDKSFKAVGTLYQATYNYGTELWTRSNTKYRNATFLLDSKNNWHGYYDNYTIDETWYAQSGYIDSGDTTYMS